MWNAEGDEQFWNEPEVTEVELAEPYCDAARTEEPDIEEMFDTSDDELSWRFIARNTHKQNARRTAE